MRSTVVNILRFFTFCHKNTINALIYGMAAPRKASGSSGGSSPPPRLGSQRSNHSHDSHWTDDLPVCHLSGVGFSTNQVYREDGFRREMHEFEDRSFHFRVEDNCFLYGVFDGHDGSKASNFAAQRMPAELLLGQLRGKTTDDDIHDNLRQAFIAVEKGFFDSIDDALAERANLLLSLPEGVSSQDAELHNAELASQIQKVEAETLGGSTATVALIFDNRLYIANAGNSRALLCKTDNEGAMRVVQISVDHTIFNEEEQQRLKRVGVDLNEVSKTGQIGSMVYTRCIGDFRVKGDYQKVKCLSYAVKEPIIFEPEIHGGIPLDNSCRFLILMTDGLYRSLEDSTGTDHVNADIASMVAAEFQVQSTLNGVAQAVVDRVVRIHHDTFMTGSEHRKALCHYRDDITLLVRNFNYPLLKAIQSPTGAKSMASPVSAFYPPRKSSAPSLFIPDSHDPALSFSTPLHVEVKPESPQQSITKMTLSGVHHSNFPQTGSSTLASTLASSTFSGSYTSTGDSTEDSGDHLRFNKRTEVNSKLELDSDGKIAPYVDFSDYFRAIEELTEAQRESLDAKTVPQPTYSAIKEEVEPSTPGEERPSVLSSA